MIPPPPQLQDFRAGTTFYAGLGVATVLADFDFETYSPAGFVWNEDAGKWGALQGASVKGLPVVGAAAYTEHPGAEVLSMAYDLKDGFGSRLWTPGMAPPVPLFNHVAQGCLLEAWNCSFEYWVWTNICVPKYNWPPLPPRQLRDAMAKSRAYALPGGLDAVGNVLNLTQKKDKEGKRLLEKFSKPRNPTKADPRLRIRPDEDDEIQKLYAYNIQDIVTEAEASSRIPDLSPDELEFWLCDQAINRRGVQLDVKAVQDCIAIVEQAHEKYNAELKEITDGAVEYASEIAKLIKWANGFGMSISNLDADSVEELLRHDTLPDVVRRALEIRVLIGSAAVKKLYAMANQVTRAGRLHDMFIYHSARTGRAAGAGPQPQNLPNSGPSVINCWDVTKCNRHFGINIDACPWCGETNPPDWVGKEWNAEAVEDALTTIATRDLTTVEYHWNDAIPIVSGCLRGMFISAPGRDLICSDYNAIEAVVLAALAGEQWRMDVFSTHGKIYEMSASKITGIPFEEFDAHRVRTGGVLQPNGTIKGGQHHPMRKKVGKVAELACFGRDTQVLTQRGYAGITDVRQTDQLWDGIEWVNHQGVAAKGEREVLSLDGVKMTPEHPINLGDSWREAKLLASNVNILFQALAIGSENLPTWAMTENEQQKGTEYQNANVRVGVTPRQLFRICAMAGLHVVTSALSKFRNRLIPNGLSTIGIQKTLSRTLKTVDDYAVDCPPQSEDVTGQKTEVLKTMELEEFTSIKNGKTVDALFLSTLLRYRAGITKCWKWIGSTVTKVTNRGIFASFPDKTTNLTNVKSETSNYKLRNLSPVYDIVNAGPRNRFTIKTKSGHLIVHNSGYQGWTGAWKQFGADEFFSDEEIKKAVLAWRKASPAIVEMWGGQERRWQPEFYGLEGAAVQAVMHPGNKFTYRGITYFMRGDVLYCQLLSGRYLVYHKPRLTPSSRRLSCFELVFEGWNTNPKNGSIGWVRINTYGGKLTENVVQATARDILAHAIVNLERAGYPVVLHVHDEIVAEVREGVGSVEEFERIMATMPAWAKDWPIKASGGWRGKRYRKD